MKIKTWLLVSYFVVMVLPVMAGYLLFLFIQGYHDDLKLQERIEIVEGITTLKALLTDPELYKFNSDWDKMKQDIDENQAVTLLNKDGIVMYASHPSVTSSFQKYGKKQLYEGLYELEQGYRSYTYRQPVFMKDELIGFFEIQIPREQWVEGVTNRALLVGVGLCIIFIVIYTLVVLFVNKKIVRPLKVLINDMKRFADGESIHKRQTKKDEMGELTAHFYVMSRQINKARKIAKQEQQAKEYLVASVSHDLKTPLTSIKAYAESLVFEKNIHVKEQKEYLRIIMEKTDFLKAMLDDLLTYTMLRSSEKQLELALVDGEEFFDMLTSDFETLCKQKGVDLHVSLQVKGKYKVDPNQMIRVMDNLVSNAISHTPTNGNIWLGVVSGDLPDWTYSFVRKNIDWEGQEEEAAFIFIQNEGKGIDETVLPHVFEPFYQHNPARSKQEFQRNGLGLSIAKQVIEEHGGWIHIFSQKNIGTCVVCMLPQTLER